MGEYIELLEHHTDLLPVDVDVHLHIGQVLTLEHNGAAGGVFQTVDALEDEFDFEYALNILRDEELLINILKDFGNSLNAVSPAFLTR